MRFRSLIILPVLLISTLVSCSEDSILPQTQNGTISISFNHTADAAENARLLENDLRKTTHMVITIKGMDGQDTEYSEKKVEVYEFEGAYLVDNIVLPIGSYQISTLYLVDDEDNVLFATPNKNKPLAQNVKIPLPATISSNKAINEVKMEVLSTKGLTPEDFGLESLELHFDDTFYFFVGLSEKGKKLDFLAGEMNISSNSYNYTLNIGAHAQKIILKRGYDNYNIKVQNKDYHPFEGSFSYDSLRAHASTLLVVSLERLSECIGGTYVGDVVLKSQEEVDDFGRKCYSKIEGALDIRSSLLTDTVGITDLSHLESIVTVTGGVTIRHNKALRSLQGLQRLSIVGGYLTIEGNEVLESLVALRALYSTAGSLVISKNHGLRNLDGLQGIRSLTSTSTISNNRNLKDLKGLDNLFGVGHLSISNNDKLESVEGLQNLNNIESLTINANASLTSVSGFGNSISSLTTLYIMNNPLLADFKGMMSAKGKIKNSVTIENNASLESFDGLEFNTDIVFSFEIKDNPLLIDISAMNDINTIGRNLTISGNKTLSSLKGLENLFSVGNRHNTDLNYLLSIVNNPLLKDFCSLSYLFQEGVVYNQNIALNAYNPSHAQMKAGECSQ